MRCLVTAILASCALALAGFVNAQGVSGGDGPQPFLTPDLRGWEGLMEYWSYRNGAVIGGNPARAITNNPGAVTVVRGPGRTLTADDLGSASLTYNEAIRISGTIHARVQRFFDVMVCLHGLCWSD